MDLVENRYCRRCDQHRPLTDFGPYKDRLQCYCRKCNSAAGSEHYRRKNPDKKRVYNINYDLKTRKCLGCKEIKPWEEFYVSQLTGLPHSRCNKCRTLRHREVRITNPELFRARERKRRYGLAITGYDEMLVAQKGRCKLCGSTDPGRQVFLVDHDHSTDKIRGLLCSKCNSGLGLFNDNPELLALAAKYIRKEGNI